MKQKRFTFGLVVLMILALLFVFLVPFKITYTCDSMMQLFPIYEWELSKSPDGNFITVHKDNAKGKINAFGVTEFQRGDVVKFVLNPKIGNAQIISIGDTIGFVYSNEEQRKLLELEGQLEILRAEYIFHTTGQKPEDVEKAKEQLEMAKQELVTQRKLMIRSETLIKDSAISLQQYDIDLNELKVKELAVSIAEANLLSVSTGDKPEQAALVKSKIEAIQLQINQVKLRINYLTLTSPVNGFIVKDRHSGISNDVIIKIIDTSSMIGIAPIRLKEAKYFTKGNSAKLMATDVSAELIGIDNVAQRSTQTSVIYLTYKIQNCADLTSGEFTPVKLYGNQLNTLDYLKAIISI